MKVTEPEAGTYSSVRIDSLLREWQSVCDPESYPARKVSSVSASRRRRNVRTPPRDVCELQRLRPWAVRHYCIKRKSESVEGELKIPANEL